MAAPTSENKRRRKVVFGIANPCYKCGKPTKHKTTTVGDEQVMVCENCDPDYAPAVGKCKKCGATVTEKTCGWWGSPTAPEAEEKLMHHINGKPCGEVEEQ